MRELVRKMLILLHLQEDGRRSRRCGGAHHVLIEQDKDPVHILQILHLPRIRLLFLFKTLLASCELHIMSSGSINLITND